jgi:hypothetical protein
MISEKSKKTATKMGTIGNHINERMYRAKRLVIGQAGEQRWCAKCAMWSAADRQVRRIYSVWDGTDLPYCIIPVIR